jgi:hypothetical protein
MMRRVMIQADERLLARAQRVAAERGVSFPQLVRNALEREVGRDEDGELRLIGSVDSGGEARRRVYEPDPWR